jgi:hypothetical protein
VHKHPSTESYRHYKYTALTFKLLKLNYC